MAKFVGYGLDEYISKLGHLATESPHICGKAVFEGAKIVGDAIKKNINSIPVTASEKYSEDRKANGITAMQKAGLVEGFGIAKMEQDGSVFNVRAGFHGYNDIKTDRYPSGQPNAMIARSLEGGTYFRNKHPFVGPAVRKSRTAAEAKMKQYIESKTKEIMEG